MSTLSRRQLEEIMLKLLLMQQTDEDIKSIINVRKTYYSSYNVETFKYFTDKIQSYCENNIHKLLELMNSKELKLEFKAVFLTKNNDLLFTELEKDIQNKSTNKTSIPKDYLSIFLILIDYSINYEQYNINETKGMDLVWKLLGEGSDEINERLLIKFLNKMYIKSSNKHKEIFIIKLIKISEEYEDKGGKILQLLKDKNQKNGIPGVTLSSNETQSFFYLDYKHNKVQDTGWVMVSNNITLYELLFQIIITWNINIDLYDIIYFIGDSKDSKKIEHSKIDYCTPIIKIFKINSINEIVEILIDFEPQREQQSIINNESLYFTNVNQIRPDIQTLLKKVFKNNTSINFLSLFSYIKSDKLNNSINKVFNNKRNIEYESMLAYLTNKTSECYLLFHLLIGFRNKDINKPYLRNVFLEDMICLKIDKHNTSLEYEIISNSTDAKSQKTDIASNNNNDGVTNCFSFCGETE